MDPEKHYWQEQYDRAAAQFTEDHRLGKWVSRRYYEMAHAHLRGILEEFKTERLSVLDVCCGSGALLETLDDLGFFAIGIDLSTGVVRRLKQVRPKDNLHALVADAGVLPFRNESFDLVISIGMLQCLRDLGGYFEELGRVLRTPKGRLLLLFSPTSWLVRWRRMRVARNDPDMAHYRLHSVRSVTEALGAAGFGEIGVSHLFYLFYMPLLMPVFRFLNRHRRLGQLLAPAATSTVICGSLRQ